MSLLSRLTGKNPAVFEHTKLTSHDNIDDELRIPTVRRRESPPWAPRRWTPLFLRRSILSLFLSAFLLVAVALAVLFYVAKKDNGIVEVREDLSYLWVFGPTIVFIAIAAFWTQVEFRTMQMMPWIIMAKGHASAHESVLLDYVSMWNVAAMFTAAKRKHWVVSIVVLGTLLVKVLIVLSTGLFVKQDIITESSATFTLASTLDDSSFTDAFQQTAPADSYFVSVGIVSQNLSSPVGTLNNLVYETVNVDNSTNVTSTVDVKVLSLTMTCESAKLLPYDPSSPGNTWNDTMQIESATCKNASWWTNMNFTQEGDGYFLWNSPGCCSCRDQGAVALLEASTISNRYSYDWRLMMYGGNRKPGGDRTVLINPTFDTVDFQPLICKPSHMLHQGRVVFQPGLDASAPPAQTELGDPTNITTIDNNIAQRLFLRAYKAFYNGNGGQLDTAYLIDPGWDGDHSLFFDPDYLAQQAQNTLPVMMAQVAKDNILTPSDSVAEGSVSSRQSRLSIRTLSFIATQVTLVLLCFISGCLIWSDIRDVCPRDPVTIAGLSTILAPSTNLNTLLRDSGAYSVEQLEKLLSGHWFRTETQTGTRFSIECEATAVEPHSTALLCGQRDVAWWRPVTARWPLRALTILAPIIFIGGLELLYQVSAKNDGLASTSTESVMYYTFIYVPALLVFVVRTIYDMLDFTARTAQQYHLLARGNADAEGSIFQNHHRRIPILAFLSALKRKHWAVISSTFAVLIAPVLSITVSSLFTSFDTTTTQSVNLVQQSRWNISDPSSGIYYTPDWYPGIEIRDSLLGINLYAGQQALTGGLIENFNLSYPQWTYERFVFPHFDLQSGTKVTANLTKRQVRSRVPALQGNLNCNHTSGTSSFANDVFSFDGFQFGSQEDNCGYPEALSFQNYDRQRPSYDFEFYNQTGNNASVGTVDLTSRPDCPTIVFMLAEIDSGNSTKATVLQCRPRIELLDVDVLLDYPSWQFDVNSPPQAVPGSETVLYDGYFNSTRGGDVFPGIEEFQVILLSQQGGFDWLPKLSNLTHLSTAELMDASTLSREMSRLYGIVVPQLINTYATEVNTKPSGDDPGQAPVAAILLNPTQPRIKQNMIATRVLEAIFATMVVCALSSMLFVDTHKVMPKNPYSIAAVASLLAGSRILEAMPPGSEWWRDKELKTIGIFEAMKFRMGWWKHHDMSRFMIDYYENEDALEQYEYPYQSRGPAQLESEGKILVYAFGAFDRYYICWQDKQGQYRQERHGLPLALERWLFPFDGTTRHLETLQVSLGHNDEFFAFDKYDRISHINTELRDTLHSIGAGLSSYSDEIATPASAVARGRLRRKSHTFSFSHFENATVTDNDDLNLPTQRRQLQQARKKVRPRSIATTGILSFRSSHDRHRSHDSTSGRQLTTWPEVQAQSVVESGELVQSPIRRRPLYTNACVQTEPIIKEQEETHECATSDTSTMPGTCGCFHQHPQIDNDVHNAEVSQSTSRSRDSSISMFSDMSSRTIDSAITGYSSTSTTSSSSTYLRNPIYMGAMNRYFRESQYRLGDSLIRGTTSRIDVGGGMYQ
ncbi:hypothetical protein PV08_07119 [Exophiala spinifera]|uniref:Uncharacterized protein n=1 Tax=Exophiala spinifera TaxID=91928 RepID=A0A0D1ZNB7_9EURO|nr:uncharacterized protein PV08_07119 [Exophiala spinifera]KIW14337.1 hypothetical protein PV08_07119 [Exophiala spinifera]